MVGCALLLGPLTVMAPLIAAAGGYVLFPAGPLRDGAFAAVGLACVLTAFVGLHRNAPRRQTGWLLVITGFLGWVVGDALFSLQGALGVSAYPSPADGVYLIAYVLMAAGLVVMVRRRGSAGDLAAVLDAAILATGAAVVALVFVVVPIASDSSLSALGKMTSTFYPAADILLLAILVRFWATPSARTTSFRLLICALGFIFAGDVYYTTTTILTGSVESDLANDLVWFAGYVLIAGATWDRSVHDLAEPAPGLEDVADPTKRLLVLTGGLLLPAVTLLADGLDGDLTAWPVVVAGVGGALPAGAGPDGGAAQRGSCAGGAAGGARPLRRAHGRPQPPHLGLRAVPSLSGGPRQRPSADAGRARPRPLQGLQRHPRPPGRRPVAQGGDRGVDPAPPAR